MKCTSPTSPDTPHHARGFAAIVAVFILVVLGGMGAVLVSVFTGQQRASALDTLGIQAYQAARAGIEVGAYRAVNGACAATTFTLAPFTVDVQCSPDSHEEAGTSINMFHIVATACNRANCPANADSSYVERQLRATVTDGE
jgi:MSHA biogenesis protein MshP